MFIKQTVYVHVADREAKELLETLNNKISNSLGLVVADDVIYKFALNAGYISEEVNTNGQIEAFVSIDGQTALDDIRNLTMTKVTPDGCLAT